MRILETDRDPDDEIRAALAPQPAGTDPQLEQTVRAIIADVRQRGDEALLDLGRKFDSPLLQDLKVTEQELDEARRELRPELTRAISAAKQNIQAFHQKQITKSWVDLHDDFVYGQIVTPIEAVGFYAPAGLAPLPSSVLMSAVPGRVAGVERLVMCAPAQKDGRIHPAMLAAAAECGVREIYKVGGAQAIAAMAFGTLTIPKVDKIVGPGSRYATEAKRQLFGYVGIDQLAGPSEILVLADDSANPAFIAADILSQAEHGGDSRCALVTTSRRLADAVLREVRTQTEAASRTSYIRESLDTLGVIVIGRNIDECIELAKVFAPEHLELAVAEPWEVVKRVRSAGTIMLGHYTPVPICDFAAGPNHVLPTSGTARFSSPLGVDDFMRKSGLLSYTLDALKAIAPTVAELAAAEGLDAHANTVAIRLGDG